MAKYVKIYKFTTGTYYWLYDETPGGNMTTFPRNDDFYSSETKAARAVRAMGCIPWGRVDGRITYY